jgi:hypothetical protein
MSDTHYIGFRDCCQQAKAFLSEEARNEYEQDPHPHGEEEEDDA